MTTELDLNNELKISIIIPIYNNEANLEKCLSSIINQSLDEIEIICVDCGSTDNSINIINNYKNNHNQIKLINGNNKSISSALNMGLMNIHGQYVIFINPNDWIKEDMFEFLYEKCESENIDLLIFQYTTYDEVTKEFIQDDSLNNFLNYFNEINFNHNDIKDILFSIDIKIHNNLFKREILKEISFFNDLSLSENVFFYESLLNTNNIAIINESFYFKRFPSNIFFKDENMYFKDTLEVLNKLIDVFNKSNYFEIYKEEILKFKFDVIKSIYNNIDSNLKEDFFIQLKKDLNSIDINTYSTLKYDNNTFNDSKLFYETVLNANNSNELNSLLRLNSLKLDIIKTKKENEIIHIQKDKLINDLNEIKIKNKNLKKKLNLLNLKLNDISDNNTKLQAQLNNASKEKLVLEDNLNNTTLKLNNALKDIDNLKEKLDSIDFQLNNELKIKSFLNNDLEKLKFEVSELNQRNLMLMQTNFNNYKTIDFLKHKNDILYYDLYKLNNQYKNLISSNSSKFSKIFEDIKYRLKK